MRALIRRIVDHILGCRPKQVAKRLEPYGWSGHIDNPEFPADWDPPSAALKVPEPWEKTEVMDFEPSDQFEMPEAMGIDYVPDLLPAQLNKLAVYNSEVSRGIVHTPEWDQYMRRLQEAFDNNHKEN